MNDDPLKFVSSRIMDKWWRLNNLYHIEDKLGNLIKFKPNLAQQMVYKEMSYHPRLIILKSRQQGISTFYLVSFFDDLIFNPHLSVGLMAQGLDEAGTLLKRIEMLWINLPDWVKALAELKIKTWNSKEFSLNNHSKMFVRTSFRSTTLHRLHISEFGKIANKFPEKAVETKRGTLQAIAPSNPVVIESTAEGHNAFKEMWDTAIVDKAEALSTSQPLDPMAFKPVFLSWVNDPTCHSSVDRETKPEDDVYFEHVERELDTKLVKSQRNFFMSKKRELGHGIYQEYPSLPEDAFAKDMDSSYYSKMFIEHIKNKGHLRKDLYDPALPVSVACDLGRNDYFTMVFFQYTRNELRIIDEFYNSGEPIQYYCNYLKSKKYRYEFIALPHDVGVTDLSYDKTRLGVFHENGVTNTRVLKRDNVDDGIELVRKMIPRMYIDPKCSFLIDSMMNYKKKWDVKLNVYLKEPVKDKYCHMADAVRYMCVSLIDKMDDSDDRYEYEPHGDNRFRENSGGIGKLHDIDL